MKNSVELLGHYGSDEVIALSAWTSTSRDLPDEKRQRIPQLLKKLWTESHETPFEKGMVHFLIKSDIATHIHFLKHRISSLNAESARYKELKEDATYIPDDWNVPMKNSLYIGLDPDTVERSDTWDHALVQANILMNQLYHMAIEELSPVLGRKRTKESARFFKMYSSQITCDVSFNMRSFANFIKLRNSPHAQKEIREIAQQMWDLVEQIEGNPFEHTLKVIKEKIDKNSN